MFGMSLPQKLRYDSHQPLVVYWNHGSLEGRNTVSFAKRGLAQAAENPDAG